MIRQKIKVVAIYIQGLLAEKQIFATNHGKGDVQAHSLHISPTAAVYRTIIRHWTIFFLFTNTPPGAALGPPSPIGGNQTPQASEIRLTKPRCRRSRSAGWVQSPSRKLRITSYSAIS
jgi:hypothetical protein